tara:strand:- start:1934 stop:2776 length:843 start_codon:yes stop_codon:yes gene_type:complete
MNLVKALSDAKNILKKGGSRSPMLDCEIIMSKVLGKDRGYVLLNLEKNLKKEKFDQFQDLIKQRLNGKPVAYLIEKKEFWNNEFQIKKDILIPRPDTEILVEQVLKMTKNKFNLRVLDIGVGSGCILLSILHEKKDFYGVGVDISDKCISLSKANAQKLGLINRVKFLKSDIDNFLIGKYDLIVTNPPYIKRRSLKYLERDVVRFEPKLALDGGLDGLSEIRKVIYRSSELIKKNGKFIIEIGFDQKKEVKNLLENKGFYINKIVKDLSFNDRCIICTKI